MKNAVPIPMIRIAIFIWSLSACITAQATTVTRASLDDLIQKSTSIVRGRVVGSSTGARGSLVYTYYRIQGLERWKGPSEDKIQGQVPGGPFKKMHQNMAGTPQLAQNSKYVFSSGPALAVRRTCWGCRKECSIS